ncbi:E3 ubiquitin-protein ligase MSL2b isoform X1 [Nerophis lumbriciformis]|uniref:E3 ubiquitin-protein ligase MSL2b isoform X1 n=1 Tax=Nerophis lumbriciformis TaxID=546530 RepID=UPI002ADF7CC4|nr:E3 ubiquitin-protein ligase MSL2-like isoform X1 [Nerophis lumbriciformis]
MNPVNATSLYVSASRSVLQCDPGDPRALAELCRLLPFFRQSLSCLVCGNLLQDPIAPTDSSCQHYVCRACKGQRMQLKPSCSWCKDYSRFQENRQLSLLVRCYRKLCLYITQSPLAPHIASAADDSPDLQAVLSEGLKLAESEHEDASDAESSPQTALPDQAPPPSEVKGEDASLNGLHDCNGLVAKQEGFSEALPVCVAAEAGLCDIGTFGEDLKHGGGPLLLSVEEVLRTLETDTEPTQQLDDPLIPLSNLNGPTCPAEPRPLPLESIRHPFQASAVAPPRCHRKRSRSESDSEKVQPLSISSLLQAPSPNRAPLYLTLGTPTRPEPRFHAAAPHHLAPVSNGGSLKTGKTALVKPLKKTAEHHGGAKKAHAKARQGAPKPRSQPRVPPHPHAHPPTHPPSPSKPLYKKPVEKKGCKCGRATQNPSVLTCRGQRCPCYSNRKACQDCICRGCQNSYMANGEKKLEAFAVPEKALEQTRLTLGINLTSIAAAALRGPTGGSPGNTILNVSTATGAPVPAAFLSGAGHDSRGFDDSLDMRFDC